MAALALSLASAKPILGKEVYGGPLTAWNWNLEDSADNLARVRIATANHHGITEADCGGRLYVDSGPEGATLCTASEDRNGFTIHDIVFENLAAEMIARKVDVLIIDPFVSSHQLNENDNTKIDADVKKFAWLGKATGAAIVLVHHSKKMGGEAVTGDSARGASALNNAARVTMVLNRMTLDQAELWGIDPVASARYFNVSDDKHNMSAAEKGDWFQIVSHSLNNGNDIYPADSVGVVTRWHPPKATDGVDVTHLFEIQKVLSHGTYWHSLKSAENWAGDVVADILAIDAVEAASRTLLFSVHGTPRPQPRPRFIRGRVVSTADPKAKLWRAEVHKHARAALQNRGGALPAFTGPVELRCTFTFKPPAGALDRLGHLHLIKPDSSNLLKLVEDVLEDAGAYVNDCTVQPVVEKWWGERAGLVVELRALDRSRVEPVISASPVPPDWLRAGLGLR